MVEDFRVAGPQPLIVRYGATAAMVLLTFALRLVIQDRGAPISSSYSFRQWSRGASLRPGHGIFAVALSTALVALQLPWLQDPGAHIVAITIFIVIGSGLTLISEALHRALERAHKAERETQLLLEEMSHRVKNKFAMVVSMLALQARGTASPKPKPLSKRSAPGCG